MNTIFILSANYDSIQTYLETGPCTYVDNILKNYLITIQSMRKTHNNVSNINENKMSILIYQHKHYGTWCPGTSADDKNINPCWIIC